jgi:hypothetical protein
MACQPVHRQGASEAVVAQLKAHFLFEQVLELLNRCETRREVHQYLSERSDRYDFAGTEQQQEMLVESYTVKQCGPIFAMSLCYRGDTSKLVMSNILVHPNGQPYVLELLKKALDATDAPGRGSSSKAKLYFLGTYPLSPSKMMKIVVREDVGPQGFIYSISYTRPGS